MLREYAKRCEKSMLLSAIFVLILGILLALEPTKSIKFMTIIIAILFMGIGGFQLFSYIKSSKEEKMTSLSLILGVILFAAGLFLFLNTESLVSFITIIIGITICIKSLFKIQFAMNIRSLSNKWKYNLLIGLIGMTLGILLLLNPFASAALFLRIVGIILIIGSIAEIIEINLVLKSLNNHEEK